MTRLSPLVLATSTLPAPPKEEMATQLLAAPALLLRHKFWLELTYTIPAVLGSVVMGKSAVPASLPANGGVISRGLAGGTKSTPSISEKNTWVEGPTGHAALVP